jgi:hypothetical protein
MLMVVASRGGLRPMEVALTGEEQRKLDISAETIHSVGF